MIETELAVKARRKNKKVHTNINGTAGRPNIIDEKLLAKLEEGFMISLTDDECCLYVGINPSTLYRYIEKNPDFSKRKELLKRTPNIQAKQNWVNEIKQGTYASSKEWLERKSKDEFSMKSETKNDNFNVEADAEDVQGMTMVEMDELRKKLMG